MHRSAGFALAVTATCLAVAAPAMAKTTARVVSLPYQGGSNIQGVVTGSTDVQGQHLGYVATSTSRRDRTVSVRVTDSRGLPVAFELAQGDSRNASSDTSLGEYCSATPRAVRLLHPGQPVEVFVELGVCGSSPSIPTTGTVSLTIR
ncbi:MAG: hypothetical protein QOC92_4889 [Acidimicrobiaceae bacterium]|jgi:hypothetical protein